MPRFTASQKSGFQIKSANCYKAVNFPCQIFTQSRCGALLRRAIYCGIFLLIILGILQQALGQDVEQTLVEIRGYQKQLEDLRQSLADDLQKAQANQTDNAGDLSRWQALAEKFIFSSEILSPLQESVEQAQRLEPNNADQTQNSLIVTKEQYQKLLENFAKIGETITAENRAELTRTDSKMYFTMRVRSAVPPKTLKAYGVMELAKQQRDQGNFAEALRLWDQAEIMVRKSFDEHIAEMAAWRERAERDAAVKEQAIKAKVEALLGNYFVAIPAGSFVMGSNDGGVDETPMHKVTVPGFKLGKTEVTFALYDLCVESTRCYSLPGDEGWGRDDRPVINVSYRDITQHFLPWLNHLTGRQYRLPSEAEWEYAARAGSTSEYAWGNNINCALARYDGGVTSTCYAKPETSGTSGVESESALTEKEASEKDDITGVNMHSGGTTSVSRGGTVPVKSYRPNAFGLYDMHGNVWEWVEDCWNPNYSDAPTDGSAWTSGNCAVRVLRGGAWNYPDSGLRSANRYYFSEKSRKPSYGFRLAMDE